MLNYETIKNLYTVSYNSGCEIKKAHALFNTEAEANQYIKDELADNYTEPRAVQVADEIAEFEKNNDYDPTGEDNFKNREELIKAMYYWV